MGSSIDGNKIKSMVNLQGEEVDPKQSLAEAGDSGMNNTKQADKNRKVAKLMEVNETYRQLKNA